MPTENRSNSTELSKIVTEALVCMVSGVTGMTPPADEPLPGFIQAPIDRAVTRISDFLAQPAQQHQGEPVALAIPEECPHIIVFDDHDRVDEHFCGAGARPAALRRFEQISRSWNAHLFVRVERNSRDDRYPSATVADLAEVERLRGEVRRLHEAGEFLDNVSQGIENKLRAQLAEAQALLRDISTRPDLPEVVRCWLETYLSASTEPSALVMQIPEGYCVMPRRLTAENGAKALLIGEFKLETTHECPECAELEEPAEGCEMCDGTGEYGQPHIIPWDQIKLMYSEAVNGLSLKQ
ncbi:hypothetical protein SJI00_07190 [Pseudomonas sp. RP23018S]|uniref:hypothetical protein n=1 Tax=Pseudomonas sp. RP23018S TaxID=3096037 RepID=UPI002ACAAECC|nr:hypothetical protein [Pseudomonas sp. RP23018S]MDZ5602554.1 hypothetical protein [Pseudomonas sp. RP23018S]